ncbi:MAG: GNAT family N-acetyltransferase, partial [Bacillota bacterium]|nr:GNAT family N-acetyltransferase [Bacillota bacterium]
TEELLMFYCLYVFRNTIYYLEEEDAIVLFQERNDVLHLFDLVSKAEVDIMKIVAKIAAPATKQVLFHYSPDYSGIQTSKMPFVDDTKLFIRNRTNINFPLHFKHPLTSHA